MRTRASMQRKKIDYQYEADRHMCEGCDKRAIDIGDCLMYATTPSMYLRANECPRNPRKRPPIGSKIRVGQGKTRAGGNR